MKVLLISSGNDGVGDGAIDNTVIPLKLYLKTLERHLIGRSLAAIVSCFCFIIVAAVIVLGLGVLFLLFVLMYSQRVATHLCETLRELIHDP